MTREKSTWAKSRARHWIVRASSWAIRDRPRVTKVWPWIVATGLSLLHGWLAWSAAFTKGPTFDEPAYLTAGVSFWVEGDYRLTTYNGPLPNLWAAAPLAWGESGLPPREGWAWEESRVYAFAYQYFYESGNDHQALLRTGRAMAVLWGVALVLVIFALTSKLLGPMVGSLAAALLALDPNFLAHSPLITSDVPVTLFMLAGTWAWWAVLERLTFSRLLLAGLLIAAAVLTKMTALLLAPIGVIMLLARMLLRGSWEWQLPGRLLIIRSWWQQGLAGLAAGIAMTLMTALSIWFAFGGQARMFPEGGQLGVYPWEEVTQESGLQPWLIEHLRRTPLLPEAYLYGFAVATGTATERDHFFRGEVRKAGSPAFFPVAFAVKTPLATLILLSAGVLWLICAFLPHPSKSRSNFPPGQLRLCLGLGILALCYTWIAITSSLNIGHRHLLPLYPVLFIIAASVIGPALSQRFLRWRQGLAAGCLLLLAVESFSQRPDYLAFFNFAVGGSQGGAEILADSSIDWGQDLPALARWLEQNQQPEEPLFLSYFGNGLPRAEGIEGHYLPSYGFFQQERWVAHLEPGLYAISQTHLKGVYLEGFRGKWDATDEDNFQKLRQWASALPPGKALPPEVNIPTWQNWERARFGRLRNYLQTREPEACIGGSIYLYRVTAEDLTLALGEALPFPLEP